MSYSWLEQLADAAGERWPSVFAARDTTNSLLATLRGALKEFEDPNYAIVVTGSLGRGEASTNSDVDWFLLVDGPSNPDHAPIAQRIASRIRDLGFRQPGRTGTFGDLVTSHALVHYIAGTRDTNENLTRRILLLSESVALTSGGIRERVIRNVLARYVIHDRSVRSAATYTIPLFFVNDVVRYWRTIASDYASKMWERHHEEWAIRNIKLRFSRKLLFVKGLLSAFAGELFAESTFDAVDGDDEKLLRLANLICEQTDVPPLELLARVVLEAKDVSIARNVFSSYDHFLNVLTDPATRGILKDLPFEKADSDPTYGGLRETSRAFRQGIDALFFDAHPRLPRLIREHGVF